jgi:E3 ubiquitin-protein ligase RAD18
MPEPYEVTDSTDWLPTPLAALAPLESSLRCQVCKDFFTTPMMTSCSHTFCSLCIRRCLSQEGRCPACREADQEVKLRRNWVVEELVANFVVSRKGLLAFATKAGVHDEQKEDVEESTSERRPRKRRKLVAAEEPTTNGIVERRNTRSQSKRESAGASQEQKPSQEIILDSEEEGSLYGDEGNESDEGERPQRRQTQAETTSPHFATHPPDEPNDGLVACPCCQRRIKEAQINSHLDKCIAGENASPSPPPPSRPSAASSGRVANGIAPPGTIAYTQQKPSQHHERLPFINYSLFNDNNLRKKLRDLGIPNHGSKPQMSRRHTEWVNLWNANCDSSHPVTKRQLLQDLSVWETTLGRQADKPANSGFMAKDFDRETHVRAHATNFDSLIQQARQSKKAATTTANAVTPQSTEDENRQLPPEEPNVLPPPPPLVLPQRSTDTAAGKSDPMRIASISNPVSSPAPSWNTATQVPQESYQGHDPSQGPTVNGFSSNGPTYATSQEQRPPQPTPAAPPGDPPLQKHADQHYLGSSQYPHVL